jgi:uncharacterized protein YbjT (DUF2867 family)
MVPPNFAARDMKGFIEETGKIYAEAIKASGIKKVVNLSSIGAHLSSGTGPIAGLHRVENTLNALPDVSITHLRAGFFYINFFSNTDMIKHMGLLGSNYGENIIVRLAHPVDIAEAAAEILQSDFTGKNIRYVISDGAAIGKPGLPWIEFTDEQSLTGMIQAGLPEEIARNYAEMGNAINSGMLWEDYILNKPKKYGKIKLEDFAKEFAEVFNS